MSERLTTSTVIVDGVALRYAEYGSGAPVVLVHGTLTGLEDWLIALPPERLPGHRVIAFDRPGNGGSGAGAGSSSVWRQAELLRKATISLGAERPVIVGHSQGGAVVMAWALSHPDEVAGVVAVSPIATPELRLETLVFGPRALGPGGEALSFATMPADALLLPALWRGLFAPHPIPTAFAEAFPVNEAGERARLRTAGSESLALMPDMARLMASYAFCRVPVTVLQGDCDLVVNTLHGRALAALTRGRFESLRGAGHMAHHSAPEAVVAAIKELSRDQPLGCAAA